MVRKNNCTCNNCDCNAMHVETVEKVKTKMPEQELFVYLSDFFKIMGDNTRLKILWSLDTHELCVCDIANVLNMTKSSISHQLAVLRKEKIVKCRKVGKTVYYSLDDEHIRQIFDKGCEHINEQIQVSNR